MMEFLRLTGTTSHGDEHPVLVAISDISSIKPAKKSSEASTIISLKSNSEFAVWVTQNFAEVQSALEHLGASVGSNRRKGLP